MSDFTIIELDVTDSTNNYAMQLIDANKAQHGLTITARQQDKGKGQRGRSWTDTAGESLLMSIIVTPRHAIREQFIFSASVAVAIANVLQKLAGNAAIAIKWPNDIIINDKKAGGILIENILRGSQWTHSIIGVGINVLQNRFGEALPYATSLKMGLGATIELAALRDKLVASVMAAVSTPIPNEIVMAAYNALLYKKNEKQKLSEDSMDWTVTVLQVLADGRLEVKLQDGSKEYYQHGAVKWEWE